MRSSSTGCVGQECAQAHQPDDLGRPVDVGREFVGREVHRAEVAPHRPEERRSQVGPDSDLPRRRRERVDDQVGAVAGAHRPFGLRLEGVEELALPRQIEPGLSRCAVDDLVGDPHEGVDVLDLGPHGRREQAGGHPERRRVLVDDLR